MFAARKIKRSIRYLSVKEPATGKLISYTGDIHHEGLMLIGESGIELHVNTPVLLEVPGKDGIKTRIPLVIIGLWARMEDDTELKKTGCRIVNPSTRTIHKINKMTYTNLDVARLKNNIPNSTLDITYCNRSYECLGKMEYISKFGCEADFINNNNVVYLKSGVSMKVLRHCHYAYTDNNGKIACRCPVRYHLCKEFGM